MAKLTTQQEFDAVQEAIQKLSGGAAVATVNIGGMSITYAADRLSFLTERETVLAARLTVRNLRKRTQPDFSGSSGR